MRAILALALKDLRNLSRVRTALFFALVWPLLVAIFFGLIFGGGRTNPVALPVGLVDEDRTTASSELMAALEANVGLRARRLDREEAADLVRRGLLVATVIVPAGFGAANQRLFYGEPPQVELLVDPSRKAERAMLEGLLAEQGGRRLAKLFAEPAATKPSVTQARQVLAVAPPGAVAGAEDLNRFLGELEHFLESRAALAPPPGAATTAAAAAPAGFVPLAIVVSEARRDPEEQPPSAFAITFPQGILWGCIGCVMSFAIGIVNERTHGTLVRLRASPLSPTAILAAKGLAAALGLLFVQALLAAVGAAFFNVRPASWALLGLAAACVTVSFVGLAMLIAAFGKTEQAASGAGWALMMPLAMLGGAMIPLIAMPAWMLEASDASPIKWALLAYEGAIWRGFSLGELALPCGILVAVGVLAFGGGAFLLRRAFNE